MCLRELGIPLTSDETSELLRQFDTNHDGVLQYEEFLRFADDLSPLAVEEAAKQAASGAPPAAAAAAAAAGPAARRPPRSQEEIDRLERAVRDLLSKTGWRGASETELKRCFKGWDKDGSGKINSPEFRTALRQLGIIVTEAEARMVLDRFDKDGDGVIDYAEFVRLADAFVARPPTSPDEQLAQSLRASVLESSIVKFETDAERDVLEEILNRTRIESDKIAAGTETRASRMLRMRMAQHDYNGDGVVSVELFLQALRTVSIRPSAIERRVLSAAFSTTEDGSDVDYGKFVIQVFKTGTTKPPRTEATTTPAAAAPTGVSSAVVPSQLRAQAVDLDALAAGIRSQLAELSKVGSAPSLSRTFSPSVLSSHARAGRLSLQSQTRLRRDGFEEHGRLGAA